MEKVRYLSPKTVDKAEYERSNNNVVLASEFAAAALGIPGNPLTPGDITLISVNKQQLPVLACLARIYVDSQKTMANGAFTSGGVMNHIENAAGVIKTIYYHNDAYEALFDLGQDHKNREHYFRPEMARDEFGVIRAAMPLYGGEDLALLQEMGEKRLLETYKTLPDDHPTKPLIGVEIQLARVARGESFEPDKLRSNFDRLVEDDFDKNPHRVATVASWLYAWGEKMKIGEMRQRGQKVFGEIIEENPEWVFMAKKERRKIQLQEYRRVLLRAQAYLLFPDRKDRLFNSLISF